MSTMPNLLKSMFARVAAPWAAGTRSLRRTRSTGYNSLPLCRGAPGAHRRAQRLAHCFSVGYYRVSHAELGFFVGRGAADLGGVAWPILPELPAALAQLCERSVPDTWLARTIAAPWFPSLDVAVHQGVRPAFRMSGCMQYVTAPCGCTESNDV